MTDNVEINPMSGGAVIAADDVAGVLVQRVKIGYGVDGAFADVHAGAPLPASVVSGTTVGSDRVSVPNAGTPVALPAHPQIYGLTVRALPGNTGSVYIGGVTVSALTGFELAPGDAISFDVANSSAVHIDAAFSGDGVCLVWVSA